MMTSKKKHIPLTRSQRILGYRPLELTETAFRQLAMAWVAADARPELKRAARALKLLAKAADAAILRPVQATADAHALEAYLAAQSAGYRERFEGAEKILTATTDATELRYLLREAISMVIDGEPVPGGAVRWATRFVAGSSQDLAQKLRAPRAARLLKAAIAEGTRFVRTDAFRDLCAAVALDATGENLRRRPKTAVSLFRKGRPKKKVTLRQQ